MPEIKAICVNTRDCPSDALQLAFFKKPLVEGTDASQEALKHIDCVSFGKYLKVELKGRQ